MNYRIDHLGLSARVLNPLRAEEIYTTDRLCEFDEIDLLKIPNLGRRGVLQIKEKLLALGLSLGSKSKYARAMMEPSSAAGSTTPPNVDLGMTLRDYFAARAMSAILSRTDLDPLKGDGISGVSMCAYAMADNMLEERHR